MIDIRHKETEHTGIFEAWITTLTNELVQAGEMTYQRPAPDRMVIDHTRVFDGFEGQGIARQMVLAAVDFARRNTRKIIPVCTYVQAVLTRTDEYRDVVAKD